MSDAVPTIILEVPTSAVSEMMERLTAFLLHHQYGFMQTFNPDDAGLSAFEIYPAQAQPGVRLMLRTTAYGAPVSLIHTPADAAIAPPETAALLQHLLETFNTPSGEA